jgi:hypothetical protein
VTFNIIVQSDINSPKHPETNERAQHDWRHLLVLTLNEKCSAISRWEQASFWWDDDDFVLECQIEQLY